jgi:glycosyltransferase involved in cell wall biosynthesis
MAFIVGKLTGRKVGTSLIAGPVELYVSSSPVGTYSYCNPLPPLTLRAKIFKWILNESDLITVTGNYTKDFLTSVGINDKLMVTMPHAIDRRFKLKDANKEYDLIFVGRLVKVKHIDVLLKAINIVKKLKPDIKVVIVGDGPCKSKLEKLSNDFNLINNVHFAGYQQNVWEWYSKAKISILTSEREGFPYSVVESLKCGVPVIASDCGDVQDLIINGYNGMIVKRYDDYQAFADKIIEILQDNAKLESYSSNSLESVSNITMENLASIWEKDILARLNKE